jgi:NADPH:quinone reductase-like Zn-dependent oxidoreductase
MDFENAAVLPVAYCTAIHGIVDLGRVREGMVCDVIFFPWSMMKRG